MTKTEPLLSGPTVHAPFLSQGQPAPTYHDLGGCVLAYFDTHIDTLAAAHFVSLWQCPPLLPHHCLPSERQALSSVIGWRKNVFSLHTNVLMH